MIISTTAAAMLRATQDMTTPATKIAPEKIEITIAVLVDTDAWFDAYGEESDEISESVRSHVLDVVQSGMAGLKGISEIGRV